MDWYHAILVFGFGLAVYGAFVSRTPRGLLWLAMLATSYIASLAYLRWYSNAENVNVMLQIFPQLASMDQWSFIPLEREWAAPSFVAFACDISIAAMIKQFGREKWETRYLLNAVLIMAAINLLYYTGKVAGWPPIPPQKALGIGLEVMNYAALFIIGGTGIMQRLGARHARNSSAGSMLGRILSSCAKLREAKKSPIIPE